MCEIIGGRSFGGAVILRANNRHDWSAPDEIVQAASKKIIGSRKAPDYSKMYVEWFWCNKRILSMPNILTTVLS